MRELTYFVATTLDGFIAGPESGDPSDTSPGGFFLTQGDHSEPLFSAYPETLPGVVREHLGLDAENRVFDTVLMGRGTWEIGNAVGLTDPYPRLATYVFSRSLASLNPSPDARLVFTADDPVATVRALKAEPGLGLWLCGGGTLAESLWPEIDRLVVKVNPVVIGDGIRLVEGPFGVRGLTLTDHQAYDSGVVVLTYSTS